MTTDEKSKATESIEQDGSEKSFFARGALLGLVGGALAAMLLISVAGSVISLFDDVFGSSTAAEAESNEPLTGEALLVATGEDLATTNGCIGCHSSNGLDGTGPTWSGLISSVDAAYIRNAIVNPNAEIAAGFAEGIMPATYSDSLSEEDLDALVAYVSSL